MTLSLPKEVNGREQRTHEIAERNLDPQTWTLPRINAQRLITIIPRETSQRTCPSIEPVTRHTGNPTLSAQVAKHPCLDGSLKLPENSLGTLFVRCPLARMQTHDMRMQIPSRMWTGAA